MPQWRIALLLSSIILSLGWLIMHSTPEDGAQLQKILESTSQTSREKAGGIVSYCQQFREGVAKELVYREGGARRLKIYSRDSELFFFRQGKDVEAVEELDNVRCLLQEELTYTPSGAPIQIVHTIEADRACYHYQQKTLTASNALVRKYRLPGHELGDYPVSGALMTAEAKQVTLNVYDGDYDLNAKGLKLILEEGP